MGAASLYFFDVSDSGRQTLQRRIVPSDEQFEEQQDRWNDLADALRPALTQQSGYAVRSWLQGSYKFATQIRPVHKGQEFDIDLGVYFCWAGSRNHGRHPPRGLKRMVQQALLDYAQESDDVVEVVVPPKIRCARIRFKGDFHIDIPCYHLDEARDSRSLATESDTWEGSDPKALYAWFKVQFEDALRAKVRRCVRYIKAWAALKFPLEQDRPPSVMLTVMVARAVVFLGDRLPAAEDEALAAVLATMLEMISRNRQVPNPVDAQEDLAVRLDQDHWGSFLEHLRSASEIGIEAVGTEDELTACQKWSEIYEHLFPLPERAELIAGRDDSMRLARAARLLPVVTAPDVQVTAVARNNQAMRYGPALNAIGPIPVNCDIEFLVTNAMQFPIGTEFRWMVRNEGGEAEFVNDLGHKAGVGIGAHERSAYQGTHYMDCAAILNGRALSVRRVSVRINSLPAPRRHPPKPAWRSIAGRR